MKSQDPLDSLESLDTEKIESLILKGYNKKASDEIFNIIEQYENQSNKELIYRSLSLLNLICDKSPQISERVIKGIIPFVNDSDSWIRLVSLEISYQISLFRPNLLIELLGKIRGRLYDQDPSVRRLTVKIIGNLILSLHIDLDELREIIEEYTEKLMDNDWKVKLNVIKTIQKILNQDYTKIRNLEPLLSMVIINLRDEDDDVARAAAELLKIHGTYFLTKENILYILLNLLYNEENRVKELIIWLFGEIGKEKSPEIISIIPKLINLLKENDYRIQLKVIDALVNIAENNFDQIWANLLNSISEANNSNFSNSLINAIYHLSHQNITEIFPYLFEELENPSENIRETIALVFKRLFEEYQIEIENEITKILYQLESRFWRERKKTIILLQNICFILESKKMAIWITIELNKALKIEKDPEVKNEITYTLQNIHNKFADINESISRIKNELSLFHKKIIEFQKIPADFREKMNSYIQNFKFNESDLQLNEKYNKILKKIKKFNHIIKQFEYKRLAFDLIEEWEETRVQIIEELSIIKAFISEICEEKKAEFILKLKEKITTISNRIDVLKVEFEYVKEDRYGPNLNKEKPDIFPTNIDDDILSYITQIRKKTFNLDNNIRDLLIDNVEFNEIFENLLEKWVTVKIEIQEYLNDLDRQIQLMKDELFDTKIPTSINAISNDLNFHLLQGHIQTIFSERIEGMKKFNDDFDKLRDKIDLLIKKNEFSEIKKLIELNSIQIQTFIEETEKEIDLILGKEKVFNDNNIFNLYIRPFLNKFSNSKELLINRLNNFIRKSNNKLYLNQIKYYLKIINPIKLDLLANYIRLNIEKLKDLIVKFISKGKLNVKIINERLYYQQIESDIPDSKEILFFKNIKTIGNEIYLNFKLSNPSNFDFKDLQISLKVPTYLNFQRKESFPKFLQINELKPGKNFKFNYVLKVDKRKELKKNLFDPSADEIKLDLYYKDQFEIPRKTTKHIDLFIQ
ncbi:MAG: hypothetical protein ACFFCE_11115 [Promethearchaeota archaeon]